MKKIKLKKPQKIDSYYVVALGNRKKIKFTNVLKANRFISDTNRFLTAVLEQLNIVMIDVFKEYRMNWYYFDTNREGSKSVRKTENNDIRDDVIKMLEMFEHIVINSYTNDGIYMTWINLNKIVGYNRGIIEKLIELNESKSYYSVIIRMKTLIKILDMIKNDLDKYPDSQEIVFISDMININLKS